MCCGDQRKALRQKTFQPKLTTHAAPEPTSTECSTVVFRGRGDFLVAGSYTSAVYHFTTGGQEQQVHTGDLPALLRTGLFEARF
jgi:hypothetical protein